MNKNTRFFKMSVAVWSLILLASLMMLPVKSASAALRECRGDPIFFLSDGTTIKEVVDISTDPYNVDQVFFLLHVPSGVTVDKVVYPGHILDEKETFQVVDDNPNNEYSIETTVFTSVENVNVIVSASLPGGISETLQGFANSPIVVNLINTKSKNQ